MASELFDDRLISHGLRAVPPPGSEPVSFSSRPLWHVPLTCRELEVLRLLSKAFTAKSIARILDLSAGTVKWHLSNIYVKLGAGSRELALEKARALKIID